MYQTIRATNLRAGSFWQQQVAGALVEQLGVAKTIATHIPEEFPETGIVARFEVAARLINANLRFRVLTAGFGDLGSHSGQAEQHPVRMQELNDAVIRFFDVLNPGWLDRITVMTFSNFGRIGISHGDGTDRGSSASHFLFGKPIENLHLFAGHLACLRQTQRPSSSTSPQSTQVAELHLGVPDWCEATGDGEPQLRRRPDGAAPGGRAPVTFA